LLAGFLFAVASGFGMPLMVEKVFPLIFGQNAAVTEVRGLLREQKGATAGDALLDKAFPGTTKKVKQVEGVRAWAAERFGSKKAESVILLVACALMPTAFFVRGVAGFFNVYWMTQCGLVVLRDIQQRVFDKLQRLPLGFFSGRQTGDLISRVMGDTNFLQVVVTSVTNDLIKQPLTLASAISYLTYKSWQSRESFFLLICLISMPLCVLPIRLIGKKMMLRAAIMQRTTGDNTAVLSETLGAAREVRAFNLEDLMARRFMEGLGRYLKLHLKVIKYRFIAPPSIEIVASFRMRWNF
jgi:subfamily B ATP-binding cassette protein MsbA